jgi:glycosyltransferase involved in cell wall biosynthesis
MKNHPTISVCTIVKNEEKQIKSFILSLVDFADEIILVDTGSSDGTPAIVKELSAKFSEKIRTSSYLMSGFHYGAAKNYAIQKATEEYIVILDVDERLSGDFKKRIRGFLEEKKPKIVSVPRIDELVPHFIDMGQERVIKNGLDILYGEGDKDVVHHHFSCAYEVIKFESPIWHCQRERHLLQSPHKRLFQVELEADRLPQTSFIRHLFRGTKGFVFKFKKAYFSQRAYKDGLRGLKYSFIKAFIIWLRHFCAGLKPASGYEYWKDPDIKLPSRDDYYD